MGIYKKGTDFHNKRGLYFSYTYNDRYDRYEVYKKLQKLI